jgi:hypothetical protein
VDAEGPTLVKNPVLHWSLRSGVLGGFVAIALLGLLQVGSARWGLRMHFVVLDVAGVLWPSSFWLLATSGVEGTLQAWVIVAMSIAANILLYAVVGGVISLLRRRLRVPGHSTT